MPWGLALEEAGTLQGLGHELDVLVYHWLCDPADYIHNYVWWSPFKFVMGLQVDILA